MIRISQSRRRWLASLPSESQLRFVKQPKDARAACDSCGALDHAVTSRAFVTWYGPIACDACGKRRDRLRQVIRRVDGKWLRENWGLRSMEEYRSAIRERDEIAENWRQKG